MESSNQTPKAPRRGRRGLLFRLMAIMLGLAPFAVAEIVFVLLDVGQPTQRDEQWRRGVTEHFRCNLRRMVRLTREAGVDMLLINPVSNLRDCGPYADGRGARATSRDDDAAGALTRTPWGRY